MQPVIIGRAENLAFPKIGLPVVPARIDTGAKTSAIWASDIREQNGELHYRLFDKGSPLFDGKTLTTKEFTRILVSTSTGHVEERYVVKHSVFLQGRKIRASFTLANRATQAYPVLVGRNILRGKFVVDVKRGTPLVRQEKLSEQRKIERHGQ
jgi:hypothetical protein